MPLRIINKCPSCGFKNISYSIYCESCRFSWYEYERQVTKGGKYSKLPDVQSLVMEEDEGN